MNHMLKTVEISHYGKDLKSEITSLDLRYNFCTNCGIFLPETSWLETEIRKKVLCQCNGSPGSELGYAGENIQLVFAGLNRLSIFLAYTSQTFSIDKILERVRPNNVMSSA